MHVRDELTMDIFSLKLATLLPTGVVNTKGGTNIADGT